MVKVDAAAETEVATSASSSILQRAVSIRAVVVEVTSEGRRVHPRSH